MNYKNPCLPQPTLPENMVNYVQKCDPVTSELINKIIDQIISNNLFILNQFGSVQYPGSFKIGGNASASRVYTKEIMLQNSSNQTIATIGYGSI